MPNFEEAKKVELNAEKRLINRLSHGMLQQYVGYNPGDLGNLYNLKEVNIPVDPAEPIKLIRVRNIKRDIDRILSEQKQKGYDDSRYFNDKNESLDSAVYEVSGDEVLNLYSNGDIKIEKSKPIA